MHALALRLIICVVNLALLTSARDVEGRIVYNEICKDYSTIGHSKVILDNGKHYAGIRQDGSFSIPDVEEGSYILNVVSHDVAFDSLRVDIHSDSSTTPDIRPHIQGTPHNPPSSVILPYPISLTPRYKSMYFVERESFNLMGMLRNPMMLMMVVMGVLMLCMPYIMKNLDPELASEVRERQAKLTNIQNAMQTGDLRGGLSALLAPEKDEKEPAPSHGTNRKPASTTTTPAKAKSGKGKRK